MKTLVVYDSLYGNTEKIAQAIGEAITGEVSVTRAAEVDVSELESLDLLVVGAPTHGGRPSPGTREFLDKVQAPALKGIKVAAFDTRHSSRWAKIFGFASKEGNSSFFLSSTGAGRIEVMKSEPDRPCHIAILVSDFEAAVEDLKAKGVELLEPNIKPTVKAVYLKNPDPAGNTVHLLWLA